MFALLIARLATLSFRDGSFPSSYKTASVTPLLKKNDLDRDNPANFRPISNLHTFLKKLFLSRFTAHVENSQTSTDSSRPTEEVSRPRLPPSGCSAMFAALLTKSADQWWYCSIYPPHSIPSTLIPCCANWNTLSGSPDLHYSGCGHTWRVDLNTFKSATTNPPFSLANSAFLRVPFSDRIYSPPTSHRSPVSSRYLASITPNMPMTRSFTSSFVTTTRCSL